MSDLEADRGSRFDAGLDGRAVVVTGAASGIGRETAITLAHAGARIVALDRDGDASESLISDLNAIASRGHLFVTADIASASEVTRAFEKIDEATDRLDGLVNSAGVREITPLLDIDAEEWERVVAVNLNGSFFCAQAAARLMLRSGGGSIVNISSVAGLVAFENRPAYTTTKAGVVGLTMTLARELAPHGIRANAIAPGLMRTSLTEAYFEDEAFAEQLHVTIPMGRAGVPRDIANMALFLLSDLSGFVSGATLPVDGAFMACGSFDVRQGETAMRRVGTGTR